MEHDILTQAKDLQTQNKEVIKTASVGVLGVIAGGMDTFYDFIPNKDEGEKSAIKYITDALWTFYDMGKDLTLSFAKPRDMSKEDAVRLLPGQHPGIFVGLSIPNSGDVLYINAYGGIRGVSSDDVHDTDTTLRKLHFKRTDEVLSQPIMINAHMHMPAGENEFDVWIRYEPKHGFSLHAAVLNKNHIDVISSIPADHHNFNPLATELDTNINSLVRLINY